MHFHNLVLLPAFFQAAGLYAVITGCNAYQEISREQFSAL